MLDAVAVEAGFADYPELAAYERVAGEGSWAAEVRTRLAGSSALDPGRGWGTTARETGETAARHLGRAPRPPPRRGLRGVVHNEAAVVTLPDGRSVAVAVFTRTDPAVTDDARAVDACRRRGGGARGGAPDGVNP